MEEQPPQLVAGTRGTLTGAPTNFGFRSISRTMLVITSARIAVQLPQGYPWPRRSSMKKPSSRLHGCRQPNYASAISKKLAAPTRLRARVDACSASSTRTRAFDPQSLPFAPNSFVRGQKVRNKLGLTSYWRSLRRRFGAVFVAEQRQPLRAVAAEVLKPDGHPAGSGASKPTASSAALDHHLAQVLDGETPSLLGWAGEACPSPANATSIN